MSVGLAAMTYALPETSASVRELGGRGLLTSDAALLERFGFGRVHIGSVESPFELGCRAAEDLLARTGTDPRSIDLLLYAGPSGAAAFSADPDAAACSNATRTTGRFRMPAGRVQHRLGLDRATVLGMDQGACTNLLAAVRTARALCMAEELDRALCIGAEFFPADAGREAIFNCTSDAAVVVLVERGCPRFRMVGGAHVSKGYYWDADARRDEMIAAYFPTARHVIEQAAARAGWRTADIDWVIPHNVSRRSWDVLLGLIDLPPARLWDRNIARIGHTLSGDNFINLADAIDAGDVKGGQKLVLFSYGYGAHWTALAVEA
jgi:3-oxoacyl-[acyl-carrier-protein] synthase III